VRREDHGGPTARAFPAADHVADLVDRHLEPELLQPHLQFSGGDELHRRLGRGLAPRFAGWVADPERAAEWVARIGLSLLWSPAPLVDPSDEVAVRRFVSTFVTPGLSVPAAA